MQVCFGVNAGLLRGQCRSASGSMQVCLGVDAGLLWGRCRPALRSIQVCFEVDAGPLWGRCRSAFECSSVRFERLCAGQNKTSPKLLTTLAYSRPSFLSEKISLLFPRLLALSYRDLVPIEPVECARKMNPPMRLPGFQIARQSAPARAAAPGSGAVMALARLCALQPAAHGGV
jgi:hypothetical protein